MNMIGSGYKSCFNMIVMRMFTFAVECKTAELMFEDYFEVRRCKFKNIKKNVKH